MHGVGLWYSTCALASICRLIMAYKFVLAVLPFNRGEPVQSSNVTYEMSSICTITTTG